MPRRVVFILLAWLLFVAIPAAAWASPVIELGKGTKAEALAFAPDGNLWFTANSFYASTDVIGRTTLGGEVKEFPLPKRDRLEIGDIAVGAEGGLWFADTGAEAIGRSNLDGQVTEFPLSSDSGPSGLVAGPDGAIWFTESGTGRLGRIEEGGSITSFALPLGSHPLDLAASDGALWVTESGRNAIARVSLDGVVTEYPLPHPDSRPQEIVSGVDGNLWFSEEGASRLGRLDPRGGLEEFDVPGNVRGTGALAAAPDGTIFFVTGSGRAWIEIGSLSPTGRLTGLGCVTALCDLPVTALTVGSDGTLWYGTGVAYYGGGGGGALLQPYFPGTIGRFEPPKPVALSILRGALRLRGRFLHVGLACRSRTKVKCVGNAALVADVPRRGGRAERLFISRRSYFRLAGGKRKRIPLQIDPFAMDILRRGALRVTLRAVVHGGPEATRRFTLRPPRRH